MSIGKHHKRVRRETREMSDEAFAAEAWRRCRNAIRNAATGAWLAEALRRLYSQ